MVHPDVLKGYEEATSRVGKVNGVGENRARRSADPQKTEASPVLFETDSTTWLANGALAHEVFGPSTILVRGESEDELLRIAESLPASLTATVHGTREDLTKYKKLIAALETKSGRLIFNGYPTGVEVSHAMHHGGPYPATADPKFTSVGTAAIQRFLRPICYQDFPDEALPLELQRQNPRKIWRMIDGQFTRDFA
jgi:NADP-dependent aldehyde dehydrogenase